MKCYCESNHLLKAQMLVWILMRRKLDKQHICIHMLHCIYKCADSIVVTVRCCSYTYSMHTYSILTLRLSAASTGLISFHEHHSAGGTLVLLLPLSV
jgi:hypothetical protein